MYEFHYDYMKNKYDNNSRLLITEVITEMSMKILATIKKCLTLVITLLGQNTMIVQTN